MSPRSPGLCSVCSSYPGSRTAAWSSLLVVLDAVGASPRLTLPSMSNGQELDIVTLDSHTHFGDQGGLPGALSLPRQAVGGGVPYSEAVDGEVSVKCVITGLSDLDLLC